MFSGKTFKPIVIDIGYELLNSPMKKFVYTVGCFSDTMAFGQIRKEEFQHGTDIDQKVVFNLWVQKVEECFALRNSGQ